MTVNRIEIRGLEEAQAKAEQVASDLRGGPFLQGMRDATLIVTRAAKVNAPVDTGRLRASITPEVREHGPTVQGVVGSNVEYAPYQELGWTTASGKEVPGKHYLRRALEDNAEKIFKLLGRVVSFIVRK
jgi:phage gpG-like protein